MTREQALNYLESSGMSKEQIQAIVEALSGSENLSSSLDKNSKKLEKNFGELPSVTPQDINYKAQYERLSKKAEIVISQLRADRDRLLSLVTPQEPKTGHWIPTYGNVKCSVCGRVKDSRDVGKATHYCSKCGAKMVEPQKSEET